MLRQTTLGTAAQGKPARPAVRPVEVRRRVPASGCRSGRGSGAVAVGPGRPGEAPAVGQVVEPGHDPRHDPAPVARHLNRHPLAPLVADERGIRCWTTARSSASWRRPRHQRLRLRRLDPGRGPGRDRARGAEVAVVGVRGHHHDALDLAVVQHRMPLSSAVIVGSGSGRPQGRGPDVDHSAVTYHRPARVPCCWRGPGRAGPGGAGPAAAVAPDGGQVVRRRHRRVPDAGSAESGCSPTEKPGPKYLRRLLLATYGPIVVEHRPAVHRRRLGPRGGPGAGLDDQRPGAGAEGDGRRVRRLAAGAGRLRQPRGDGAPARHQLRHLEQPDLAGVRPGPGLDRLQRLPVEEAGQEGVRQHLPPHPRARELHLGRRAAAHVVLHGVRRLPGARRRWPR